MTSRRLRLFLCGAILGVVGVAAPAAAYLADAVTGPALNLVGTNLFVSATSSNPAPVGRALWFVADVSLNGVPLAPQAGAVLGPDDVLLHQDAADGMILGNAPGQYKRTGVEVADVYANANIFVYLWSVDTNAAPGSAGQTFDVLNLGVLAPPEVGNAAWLITTPLFSDRYLVLDAALLSAPEPSLLWLVAAGLAVIGVAKRATAGY
jgi:hypothetical protein